MHNLLFYIDTPIVEQTNWSVSIGKLLQHFSKPHCGFCMFNAEHDDKNM